MNAVKISTLLFGLFFTQSVLGEIPFSEQLYDAIKYQDKPRVVSVINDVNAHGYYDPVYELFILAWKKDGSFFPKLDKSVLDSTIVRVKIAFLLAQANRNRIITISTEDMYLYGKSLMRNKNAEIRSGAFDLVSVFDRPEDIPIFKEYLYKSDMDDFRASISALFRMCSANLNEIVDDVKKNMDNEEKEKYMEHYVTRDARQFRKQMCQ